jgi:preprotein translocase subunit SecA
MFNFVKKILGDGGDRAVKQIEPLVRDVNDCEPELQALTDEQLGAKTAEFRERLAAGETLDDLLPEAFATVREAARRTIGQRHYDVQLIGGIVLHQGKIAEMKTGEGKTLVATLPLYLNALEGRGCHLVTVNDYLAKVGAGWMGPIYSLLGLSVGMIAHDYSALFDLSYVDPGANQEDQRLVHWRPCTRREAYGADITYGTNNEFGFDYLRDNMVLEQDQMVQRELHYAIVDEVDNILIDEARTPLIISGPAQQSSEQYKRFARLVPSLKPSSMTPDQAKKEMVEPDGDFMIDPRSKSIQITDSGIYKVERALGVPEDESMYDPKYYEMTHFLENALRAQFIYHRDRDYVVEGGEVVIVDEFTGRKMPGRRWSDGLHQAVEAKENVPVKQENVTLATITFQNYFRMYHKLGGMTGTAWTEREELGKIYNLDVVVIPTNRAMVRKDLDDQVYSTEKGKFDAVIREIEEMREIGRPVLVGTTSVETSERLSRMLQQNEIPHQVLNAKQHEREASVVAQAGRASTVTIATNMAGRGTDILLGGNPDGLVEEILAERKIKLEEATPEQMREALDEARRITEKERRRVLEAGGLHIIGTERHEARRIDNQLRGRAGRQGDAGSSRFYLSLEDELLRRFAMDRVRGIMGRIGVDDGTPIEAGLLSKVIENAQHKVEGYNFDMRKHTVEFDDVMNQQRTVIYADRREILAGKNMRDQILDMIRDEIDGQIAQTIDNAEVEPDYAALLRAMRTIDPRFPAEITPEALAEIADDELADYLMTQVEDAYAEREQAIGEQNMRYVERRMMLAAIDNQWIDYLTGMDNLRQEIGLQAIAQRDPLTEYQRNASLMFQELKENIQRDIVYRIIPVSYQYEQALRQAEIENQQRMAAAHNAGASEEQLKAARTVRKETPKIGRNDLCPCGSGKKFKYCHEGREGELFALLQGRGNGGAAQATSSVSAQLATGQAGVQKPAGSAPQRGRAVPPAASAPQGNGKRAKAQPQAQRGKGQAKRK